jgi:hypothetical protein
MQMNRHSPEHPGSQQPEAGPKTPENVEIFKDVKANVLRADPKDRFKIKDILESITHIEHANDEELDFFIKGEAGESIHIKLGLVHKNSRDTFVDPQAALQGWYGTKELSSEEARYYALRYFVAVDLLHKQQQAALQILNDSANS